MTVLCSHLILNTPLASLYLASFMSLLNANGTIDNSRGCEEAHNKVRRYGHNMEFRGLTGSTGHLHYRGCARVKRHLCNRTIYQCAVGPESPLLSSEIPNTTAFLP